MKPLKLALLIAGLIGSAPALTVGQTNPPVAPAPDAAVSVKAEPASGGLRQEAPSPKRKSVEIGTNAFQRLAPVLQDSAMPGQKELRLNFRGVPLEMVLDYLSDAAGFIINLETEVKGTVDVWSNQPLNKQEAVGLLNAVLNRNGYAAIQHERTLTIVGKEEAKKRDIPVRNGSNPAGIPKTDEIVTQIIPVRSLNAMQLAKDLSPLLPSDTTLTANEAGNALVMTDTQINIRRLAEIITALDSNSSGISTIKVFPLLYADAKALVTIIKEVFPDSSSRSSSNDPRSQFYEMLRSRYGHGSPSSPSPAGSSSSGSGNRGGSRVAAAADENSNALVVSAPADMMPAVEELIREIDADTEDITEVRVFRLKHADPSEMADLLAGLFPDDTQTGASDSRRASYRYGSSNSRSSRSGSSGSTSDRMKKKGRVIAVPDQRTASVVVSADKALMCQIAVMIEELDNNPAKKQKVFVYSLENADVQAVEESLRELFESGNSSRNNRSSRTQSSNVLNTRTQQMQNSVSSANASRTRSNSR